MTTDFRALCAELLVLAEESPSYRVQVSEAVSLIARARALLDQPVAEGPQPVPVSERLPGPEDCTEQGWCWVFYRGFATWTLEPPLGQDGKHTGYTHWLPANALPTPEATNAQ